MNSCVTARVKLRKFIQNIGLYPTSVPDLDYQRVVRKTISQAPKINSVFRLIPVKPARLGFRVHDSCPIPTECWL